MEDPRLLSDNELIARLEASVQEERGRLHDFLACLGEADDRKALEKRGYASTFDFCVRRLRLSHDEAYRRIHAARAAIRRPEILSALADGELSLTAVSRIAPHVHRPDAPEIIARAQGKSVRQIEDFLAPLSPEPPRKDRIRSTSVIIAGSDPGQPPRIERRIDVSFQAPPSLRDAIDRVKELLAHKYPFGDMEDILLEVIGEYLKRHDPQGGLALDAQYSLAQQASQRTRRTSVKGSASIPSAVRRAVWARDGGRCSFIGEPSVRCESRRMLEIDHCIPRSRGGSNELDNLRLLCRSHNDTERRRILGEGKLSTNLSRDKFVDNSSSNTTGGALNDQPGCESVADSPGHTIDFLA